MPAIADVASQLISADLPVLFLDTCTLLDIIRAIKRRNSKCVAAASDLQAAVSDTPARCSLVVSNIVSHEWRARESELQAEAIRHLSDLDEHSAHFHDACGLLGIVPSFTRASYSGLAIADKLRMLSKAILDSAIEVAGDDECKGKAFHRVLYNIPPSKKGGEAKDCNILEEYLAICRHLQTAGFDKKKVFCTSNTNDYCEGGSLHSQLFDDFAAVKLRLTTNLSWGVFDALT